MSEPVTPPAPAPARPAEMHLVDVRDGDPPVLYCEVCWRFLVVRPGETDPRCPICGAAPCSSCAPILAPMVHA